MNYFLSFGVINDRCDFMALYSEHPFAPDDVAVYYCTEDELTSLDTLLARYETGGYTQDRRVIYNYHGKDGFAELSMLGTAENLIQYLKWRTN